MKLKGYKLENWNKYKFSKTINLGEINLLLLEIDNNKLPPSEGLCNLILVDSNENIIWIAKLPTKNSYDLYFDMDFKENKLLGWTSNSMICEIDIKTGEILNNRIIK
jgi:hypothetical protein